MITGAALQVNITQMYDVSQTVLKTVHLGESMVFTSHECGLTKARSAIIRSSLACGNGDEYEREYESVEWRF